MHHHENESTLRRRSIRLSGYDYSSIGAYFITVCTHHRECLFGDVCDSEVRLNHFGLIVRDEWLRTAELRQNVEAGTFVVMPNHLHGILVITNRVTTASSDNPNKDPALAQLPPAPTESLRSPSKTVGAIVRGFKSSSTKRITEA